MNLGEMLTQLRLELRDTVATVSSNSVVDQLWSDTQLVNYLNWAEREFTTRTGCLRDITSSVTQIPLVAGQQTYAYDPRILDILSVSLNAPAGVPNVSLWPMAYSEIDPGVREDLVGSRLYSPSTLTSSPFQTTAGVAPPAPKGWAADQASYTLTIFPNYNGAWPWTTTPQLNLRVVRMPLNAMNANILPVSPETPNQYHMLLVWGAARQALLNADQDAYSPQIAATYQQRWEVGVLEARRDFMRQFRKNPRVVIGDMGSW